MPSKQRYKPHLGHSVRVPNRLWGRLVEEANAQGCSVASVVAEIIAAYIGEDENA